jgi:hypothetical protein
MLMDETDMDTFKARLSADCLFVVVSHVSFEYAHEGASMCLGIRFLIRACGVARYETLIRACVSL